MRTFLLLLGLLVLLAGCTNLMNISEVKSEEFVNQEVSVKGVVVEQLALGELSGFTLQDENNDTIFVYSNSIPAKGENLIVTGTLEDSLLGYYINRME